MRAQIVVAVHLHLFARTFLIARHPKLREWRAVLPTLSAYVRVYNPPHKQFLPGVCLCLSTSNATREILGKPQVSIRKTCYVEKFCAFCVSLPRIFCAFSGY